MLLEEVAGEKRDVRPPLAERRHDDRDHLQAVEEILAEVPLLDLGREVLVRGGEDANVHLEDAVGADGTDLAVLENPKELHLEGGTHLADLVEEDGAPVRELEHAGPLADRAGERAPLVAEHLRLEELGRDRAAVDRNEGAIHPGAERMDGAGDQLLARAALTHDEDGGIGGSHLADELGDLLNQRVFADQMGIALGRSVRDAHAAPTLRVLKT